VLVLHLVVIHDPAELMFDEAHYVKEARSILAGEGLIDTIHPSLGKLFIAGGIWIFGDGPFGWRIFPVLFGVASIVLFYFICRRLTTRRYVPLLATYVFAFENLSFVQSGIAMLDVFSLTFMLSSFLLYLQNRHMAAGVFLALSASAKIPGAFAVLVILAHFLLTRRREYMDAVKFLVSTVVAFLALMTLFDFLATDELLLPWDRLRSMSSVSFGMTVGTVTHGAITPPWEWIIKPQYVDYWYNPSYVAAVSWNLWGVIIPLMGYAVWRLRQQGLLLFSVLWFAGTYLVWIPIELITDRITFFFYFYPTVGALCLVAAFCLNQLWRWRTGRLLAIVWLVSHLVLFLVMGPLT